MPRTACLHRRAGATLPDPDVAVKSSRVRAAGLVVLAAVAAYANSLGNGLAYDDTWVLGANPIVTEGRFGEVLTTPYWPKAVPGTGNYRPLTVASFAAEWKLFDGSTTALHAVSVGAHAVASLAVFVFLAGLTGVLGGLVGGLFFAVHPVHVEAVANLVGRAEPYAALFVVGAVLVFRRTGEGSAAVRALGILGVAVLYALGLASKEIAVTLPGLLLAVAVLDPGAQGRLADRIGRVLPHLVVLGAVLVAYLVVRTSVLGVITGESPAAGLRGLSRAERLFTALSIWPQYLRLMMLPWDLSMDYQPAVLPLARGVTLGTAVGALVLGALGVTAWRLRRTDPDVALGLVWFFVAVLPVSNLLVRSDILLAERTLYLPSVGAALVVAAVARRIAASDDARLRRWALVLALAATAALMVRTVTRNPTWMDTFTALSTLAEEHPESYMALRSRAAGYERVGSAGEAAAVYATAMAMVPDDYTLTLEVGDFHARQGRRADALDLYRRAIALIPSHPAAYQRQGVELIREGRYDQARTALLEGLRRSAFPDRQLWSLLSESWIGRGDLEAAVRARRAALGVDADSREDWRRLAELYEAMGRTREAAEAREREAAAPEASEDPAPRRVS